MKKRNLVISFVVGLTVVLLVAVGCEKTQTGIVLEVAPSVSTIPPLGTVVLRISIPDATNSTQKIYYPLTWTVSKASLGTIQEAVGNSAVYVATTIEGVNTVIVRDQTEAEGIALIETQIPPKKQ